MTQEASSGAAPRVPTVDARHPVSWSLPQMRLPGQSQGRAHDQEAFPPDDEQSYMQRIRSMRRHTPIADALPQADESQASSLGTNPFDTMSQAMEPRGAGGEPLDDLEASAADDDLFGESLMIEDGPNGDARTPTHGRSPFADDHMPPAIGEPL